MIVTLDPILKYRLIRGVRVEGFTNVRGGSCSKIVITWSFLKFVLTFYFLFF